MNRGFNRKPRFLFFLFVPLIIGALGGLVMWLWNAIVPDLTGFQVISFWQALGLFALCRLLFGGWGFRKPGFGGNAFRGGFKERFRGMSDDERKALRDEWKRRCGR